MDGDFNTTQWTTVLRAMDRGDPAWREALNTLLRDYEVPVRHFVRRWTASDDDYAREVVQSFFMALLERGVPRAEKENGKFRYWLRGCVKNHVRSLRRKQKRASHLALDDAGPWTPVEDDDAGPDRQFDRQWALTVFEHALASLARDAQATKFPERFAAVRPILLSPPTAEVNYAALSVQLGLTEGNLRIYVMRLRESFVEHVRAELARQVRDQAELEEELRFLIEALMVQPVA